MPRACLVAVVVLGCAVTTLPAQSGQLGQVRREMIRTPSAPETKDPATDEDGLPNGSGAALGQGLGALEDGLPNGSGAALGQGLGALAMVVGTGPALVLEDDMKSKAYFPAYPHDNDETGYMTIVEAMGKEWACRVLLEGGTNFDDVHGGDNVAEMGPRRGHQQKGAE